MTSIQNMRPEARRKRVSFHYDSGGFVALCCVFCVFAGGDPFSDDKTCKALHIMSLKVQE